MKLTKARRYILYVVIGIVLLTHRHEDYCTRHPHNFSGSIDQPLPFGPWVKKESKSMLVDSNLILKVDELIIENQ